MTSFQKRDFKDGFNHYFEAVSLSAPQCECQISIAFFREKNRPSLCVISSGGSKLVQNCAYSDSFLRKMTQSPQSRWKNGLCKSVKRSKLRPRYIHRSNYFRVVIMRYYCDAEWATFLVFQRFFWKNWLYYWIDN